MHILVVSQYFWPEDFRVNDLVKEWTRRNHRVTVLTGVPNYPNGRIYDLYRRDPSAFVQYEHARVIRVPMLPRGSGNLNLILNYISFVLGASIWGPWLLRDLKPDVIFVFEPSPVTVGLPAVLIGKIKKIPVVFWVLDLWPETLTAIGVVRSPRLLSWIGYVVRFIYNRCTLVLGQSKGFLVSIAKYCSDKSKIRYFPNWSEDLFAVGPVAAASEVPSLADSFTILFSGNIGEAQDMPAVLDAVERLKHNPAIRWVIVGDGRKLNWLQHELIARGLQEHVLLPGRFPVERMPSFYAHADALLVSLKQDPIFSMTIPGKVQSYLAAGIPILGMLDGEGASVIQEARAGLTCPAGDGASLAAAATIMASMSIDQRKQLGENGRHYAQKEFGRAGLIDRLEALLHEAIARNKPKAS